MKALLRGAVAAGTLLALATAATGATPAVAITSPEPGATVSRAAGTFGVTGTFSAPAPEQDERTFFLRRSTCMSGNDDARLALEPGGATEVNGCSFLAQPANEVLIATDAGLSTQYAAAEGLPLTLDASRPLGGSIQVTNGVGVVTVETTLRGVVAGVPGEQVLLSSSATYTGTVLGSRALPVTGTLPAALDKKDLTSLTLDIRVRGVNAQGGAVDNRNGVSRLVLPVWSGSFAAPSVDVSTTATFPASGTRRATLAPDGTWSVQLPVPATGAQKVHARLVQGPYRTVAAPVDVTVVP